MLSVSGGAALTETGAAAAKAKAKAEAKAKKAAAPKKAASAGPKVGTIGAVANAALMAGKTNDEALAAVKKMFPKAKTNLACISWYRGKLREIGKLPKAAAPAKAKAATKRSARPTKAGR